MHVRAVELPDRLAVHVEAVLRDPVGHRGEHRVGRRRAVAREHLERLVRAQLLVQLRQHVDQFRIDPAGFLGANLLVDRTN